jgi:hypothetical integral membrane protein (TIGR02206 family)
MRQFSDPHLAALAVLVLAASAAVWIGRHRPGRPTRWFAGILAGLIFAAWAGEYTSDAILGIWSARADLPLQLTDAVSLTAILALLTRRQLLVELLYFWALSASLQAILTPDLGQDFPSVFYFTYFGYHIGSVVAAFLLVFGCGRYPRPRSFWWVWALTLGWAAIAGIGDVISGGNYMYLRFRPVHNSLLTVMGAWPWYIAETVLLGLVMLIALQWIADACGRRDPRSLREAAAVGAA